MQVSQVSLIFLVFFSGTFLGVNTVLGENIPDKFTGDIRLKACFVKTYKKWKINLPYYFETYWSDDETQKKYNVMQYINFTTIMYYLHDLSKPDIKEKVDTSAFLFQHGTGIKIPDYGLQPGHYQIIFKFNVRSDASKKVHHAFRFQKFAGSTCLLNLVGFPPIAVIPGGNYRLAPGNVELEFTSFGSRDVNSPDNPTKDLRFEWSCKQKIVKSFCISTVSTQSSLKIPGNSVRDGDKITVSLTVLTPHGYKSATSQVVEVKNDVAQLKLICQKNCQPATNKPNLNQITFLNVDCILNCDGIKDKDYKWTISDRATETEIDFDYKKNTKFGRNTIKFVIKKTTLSAKEYEVSVKLQPRVKRQGEVRTLLTFGAPPKIEKCTISPQKGKAAWTLFSWRCFQHDQLERNHYELVAKDINHEHPDVYIADGFYPSVFDYDLTLPASKDVNFMVIVTPAFGGTSIEIPLKVEVVPFLSKMKNASKALEFFKELYDSKDPRLPGVLQLIISNDSHVQQEGFRLFSNMVVELIGRKPEDAKINKFIQVFKHTAAKDVMKTSIPTLNDIIRVANALTKLISYNEPSESEPIVAQFTTTLCKKMAEKNIEMLKKEPYPMNLAKKANEASQALSKCFEINTNPNYKILEPVEQNISIDDPVTSSDLRITENYENYIIFNDIYYQNLARLKEISFNIVNGTILTAKMMARTTAIGEDFAQSFGKTTASIVAKDKGKYLISKEVASQGVTLLPSQDFANSEHSFDILVSTWRKNIFWWQPDHIQVSTDIANIEFWHSTCKERIYTFQKPVELFFQITKGLADDTITEDYFYVPENFSTLSEHTLNYKIKVRRFFLPRKTVLNVQFDHNSMLEIIWTKFRFPTIDDFKRNASAIDKSLNFVQILNNKDYDIWSYIGILAKNTNNTKNLKITFSYSYVLHMCVTWVNNRSSWIVACQPGTKGNKSVINCLCNKFSVLAGYAQKIKSMEQNVMIPMIRLDLQPCYIICLTVTGLFLIYCVLLVFVLIEKSKLKIYYLSDNDRTHRFAYLVQVTTGKKRNSGTTANILIKLIGDKHSSDAHVLNFPDPKMQILQKCGNDMFILATKNYLGDLVYLELWIDGVGVSPNWICDCIIVFDMQQKVKWKFNIKKTLAVKNGKTYLAEKPNREDLNINAKFTLEKWNHLWCLNKNTEDFTYINKLSVLFSKMLSIFAMSMLSGNTPDLKIKDTFDLEQYIVNEKDVAIGFFSSLIAFIIHHIILCGFRFRSLKSVFLRRHLKITPPHAALIARCTLATIITISMFLLLLMGFWVPYNKSLVWLTSSAIGTAFDIIIFEVFGMYLQNTICKGYRRQNIEDHIEELWNEIERQRLYLYTRFGDHLLRPYFKNSYKPLTTVKIKKKENFLQHRLNVITELEDLLMFGTYVIILYVVILTDKAAFIVLGKTEMEEILEGVHTRTIAFSSLTELTEIFNYINSTLIPAIQGLFWYGNYSIASPGLMIDMSNKYIGVVRFRQERLKTNSCIVPTLVNFLNLTCQSQFLTETKDFGYSWKGFSEYFQYDRLKFIWKYSKPHETGTFATFGEFAIYSGGGYLAFLGRTLFNSYVNFSQYFSKFWINQQTRCFFIEFLTYNANYNIFSSIKLLFEESVSGYNFKTVKVNTLRMLFVKSEISKSTGIFFLLFIFWVFLLFFRQSLGFVKKIKSVWKTTWFWIDVFIIVMSVICIIFKYVRTKLVGRYLDILENVRHNAFTNYFYLFYFESFMTFFAAVLICVATIRLWKFLRFGKMFLILERTLSIALGQLITIFFVYCILVLGFSMTLIILRDTEIPKIDTLSKTITTFMIMALNSGSAELTRYKFDKMLMLLFTYYAIVLKCIVILFIAAICLAYTETQIEFSSRTKDYNVNHFILEKIQYIPKYCKYKYFKVRGGKTHKSAVEAKAEKFFNAQSVKISVNKLEVMKHISISVIKNSEQYKKHAYDWRLMLGVCRQFVTLKKQETYEVFFKTCLKKSKIHLQSQNKMFKMEKVVKILLNKEGEDKKSSIVQHVVMLDTMSKHLVALIKKMVLIDELINEV